MHVCMHVRMLLPWGRRAARRISETESAWVLALKMAYHMGSLDVAHWTEEVFPSCVSRKSYWINGSVRLTMFLKAQSRYVFRDMR